MQNEYITIIPNAENPGESLAKHPYQQQSRIFIIRRWCSVIQCAWKKVGYSEIKKVGYSEILKPVQTITGDNYHQQLEQLNTQRNMKKIEISQRIQQGHFPAFQWLVALKNDEVDAKDS